MKDSPIHKVWLLAALLLAGCASAPAPERLPAIAEPVPPPPAEPAKPVEPPKPVVSVAEAQQAMDQAAADIRETLAHDALWRDTAELLEQAEQSLNAGDAAKAKELAESASWQAITARQQFFAEAARQLINDIHDDYPEGLGLGQQMRLGSAETALAAHNSETAYTMVSELWQELRSAAAMPEPVAEPAPEPAPMVLQAVSTKPGDTLWDIAARPEVYGNPDMWPLLLKANQAKIKRADRLPAGITLVIDRQASEAEIQAAITHSKKRGAPILGPVDAFDRKYLGR